MLLLLFPESPSQHALGLIIELLAYDVSVRDDTAIQYHFTEVANANDAPLGVHSTILSSQTLTPHEVPNFPSNSFRATLVGQQAVSKVMLRLSNPFRSHN